MNPVSRLTKSYFTVAVTLALCLSAGCSTAAPVENITAEQVFTQAAQTAWAQETGTAVAVVTSKAGATQTAALLTGTPAAPDNAAADPATPTGTSSPASESAQPTATISAALTPTSPAEQPATPSPMPQNPPPAPGNEAACLPAGTPQTGKVLDILDGDTIKVMIDGKTYTVRYIGIDAPEYIKSKEFYSTEARQKNSELVFAKDITLYKDVADMDANGRLLRYVKLGDTFVNWNLVSLGFAKAAPTAPNSACDTVFQSAQDQASAAKAGVWGNP